MNTIKKITGEIPEGNVYFPDSNFLQVLIDEDIDTNNEGQISYRLSCCGLNNLHGTTKNHDYEKSIDINCTDLV